MKRREQILNGIKSLAGIVRRQLLWHCGKYRFASPGGADLRFTCVHAEYTVPIEKESEARLRDMAARLDGLTLWPGETFSYWRAMGGRLRRQNGGALAGLLLWISLHTPLTVEECRFFGGMGNAVGAACTYPQHDLMLTNDTSQSFQLRLRAENGELRGEWLCDYEPYVHYQVVGRGRIYRQMLNPDGEILLEEAV